MFEISFGIISVAIIAASQLLFKSATSSTSRSGALRVLLHPKILLGLALNVIAAACWIIALRKIEISYLYPILATNYLLVPIGARWIFGEKISRQHFLAVSVICVGVFVCLLGKQ